jgi:hypothetical protein
MKYSFPARKAGCGRYHTVKENTSPKKTDRKLRLVLPFADGQAPLLAAAKVPKQ